ncbi:hypothetical protein HDF15_001561 [Granulicella mallensis]|uniref:Uncharacterized protein n=1 Tax=Granulicella mallensis TaxID=940614 RepID=A0A7W7ZQ49_9BACT|nr:hypothetical protein [Granulicella mallensis]
MNEKREEAGSLPFGYAQGRNDNQKGKDNGKTKRQAASAGDFIDSVKQTCIATPTARVFNA